MHTNMHAFSFFIIAVSVGTTFSVEYMTKELLPEQNGELESTGDDPF